MPVVTGNLRDLATRSLNAYKPVITFLPSGPGVHGSNLYASQPITVTPAVGTAAFSVTLADTTAARPDLWYTVEVRWLDPGGNYVFVDRFPWKLRVPADGGAIGDLMEAPTNPWQAVISTTEPVTAYDGLWWLDPNTGDLMEWK